MLNVIFGMISFKKGRTMKIKLSRSCFFGLAALAILMISDEASRADQTVSYSNVVTFSNFGSILLPKFDSTLGTLLEVRVDTTLESSGTSALFRIPWYHLSPEMYDHPFAYDYVHEMSINGPGVEGEFTYLWGGIGWVNRSFSFESAYGEASLIGTGWSSSFTASNLEDYVAGPFDMNVAFNLSQSLNVTVMAPGYLEFVGFLSPNYGRANLGVTYTYRESAPPPTAVPEPGTACAAILAWAVGIGLRRRGLVRRG